MSKFGSITLASFLSAQVADGLLTYQGLQTIGLHIEANPVLSAMLPVLGLVGTLIVAKSVAAVAGTFLFAVKSYRILAALTAFYLVFAVLPWMSILFVR